MVRAEAERDISFDHGPDGSVTEDHFFSMIAFKKGYSFDFIDGEMQEKSPFTISDLINQRKRWTQGSILVANSPEIPLKNKLVFLMGVYSAFLAPLDIFGIGFWKFYPLLGNRLVGLDILAGFTEATCLYTLIFGIAESYSLKEINTGQFLLGIIGNFCLVPLSGVIVLISGLRAILEDKNNFFIVKK